MKWLIGVCLSVFSLSFAENIDIFSLGGEPSDLFTVDEIDSSIIEEIAAEEEALEVKAKVETSFEQPKEQSVAFKEEISLDKEVTSPLLPQKPLKKELSDSLAARPFSRTPVSEMEINLFQVFSGAPIIYLLLFSLSIICVCIWLYSMMTIRSKEFLPRNLIKELRSKLISNQFGEALELCTKDDHFFCKILASGILARKHGLNMMFEAMKAEGKRATIGFWQRIGLLNDIAIIAPMLGLLGTVLGMFYAFYDLNRSMESVSILFDGLGISVGTTVAGLIVAILAMVLHSVAKYRLMKLLARLENEAQSFAALIDTRQPKYLES